MKINKKKIFKWSAIISGIFIAVALIGSIIYGALIVQFLSIVKPKVIDRKVITSTYNDNKSNFANVVEFIRKINADVYIERVGNNKYSIKKSVDNGLKDIEVPNEKIDEDIKYILYKLNFEYISVDLGSIFFTTPTSFGFQQGIAYSIDGKKPRPYRPRVLENIDRGWYYYEGE